MNEQERELDMALADAEQENRKLRAEIQLLTEALRARGNWVDLTDHEREGLVPCTDLSGCYYYSDVVEFLKQAEAKLKEKNYGA